ncbi:MAG: hypothetical protein K8M05_20010, partial [Deltaproteobacteria bacterium]|nr:hypothetical protein [Kofleriaceae bacterium]
DEVSGRVLRIDARGRRTVLASGPGMSELAVAGATIAYRAGDAIWSKDGAAAPVRAVSVGKARVLGLVLAGDRLYWSDTQRVQTAPRSGGAAAAVYDPPRRSLGTGAPDAQLVIVDGTVYFSTLGWGSDGIQRVVDATTSAPLYETFADDEVWVGDSLARAGDALYISNSAGQIVRAPLAGGGVRAVVTGIEGAPVELAGGGDRLVAQYVEDGAYTIAAVDPLAGKLTVLVSLPGEDAAMLAVAPAGDAVYAGLRGSDLIVRIPLPPVR